MRYSRLFGKTLRQKPHNVEIRSHELLLRGGFIFPVAAGIYDFLPLGFRVLEKIDRIIKEELAKKGVQHLIMPFVHPASLWRETGRFEKMKRILAVFDAAHGGKYLLAPTHEETVTDLARNFILSYRDLPVIVNQNQWKYRNEIRVTGGLLRTREFLMQDAYSFDKDEEGLAESFKVVSEAYHAIFKRMDFETTVVKADSGAIGGTGSEEFMVLSPSGEDSIIACDSCTYKANIEKAESIFPTFPQDKEQKPMKDVLGKGLIGVEPLAKYLNISVYQTTKTLIYQVDNNVVAVCIRGDFNVNEVKLANILGCSDLTLATEETIKKLTVAEVGYAGPLNLPNNIKVYWDYSTNDRINFEAGANRTDYHTININFGSDIKSPEKFYDFRSVKAGEICSECRKGKLAEKKAIELGHVFKLGTVYSEAMNATFLDKHGKRKPIVMGCYGIGITRLLAAAVEQHHDDRGIIWPKEISSYNVHLISLPGGEEKAEKLYISLKENNVEVLWDDRDESAGVKFSDADLIGIPVRLVISAKTGDKVEYKIRSEKQFHIIEIEEAIRKIKS